MSEQRRLPRWIVLLIGFACGIALLAVGLKYPNPSISGFAESTILDFDVAADFYSTDIVGRTLTIAFDGQIKSGSNSAIPIESGVLSVSPGAKDLPVSTIAGFSILRGSNVALTADDREGHVTMEITGPALALEILPAVDSQVQLNADSCNLDSCGLTEENQDRLTLLSNPGSVVQISVDMSETGFPLANRIEVSELRFWELERFDNILEKRSGLEGGAVRFLETPDKTYAFQPGEIISLSGSSILLRSVEQRGRSLRLQFSGAVRHVDGEIAGASYSLKPNLFDWFVGLPWVKYLSGLFAILLSSKITFPVIYAKMSAFIRRKLGRFVRHPLSTDQ